MFDMVDTAFSIEEIVCQFLQESFKVKESSYDGIWNADTAFILNLADLYLLLKS